MTVVTVTGPTDVLDTASRNAEDTLRNIASMMFYRHAGGGSWIKGRQSAQVGHTSRRVEYKGPYHPIMLSPSRAVILAEAGMSKRDTQEWLHERCRVSLREAIGSGVPTDVDGKWRHHPELQHLADDPDATIAALEDPEQYLLFVTGGSTHYANFFNGTYGIAPCRGDILHRPIPEIRARVGCGVPEHSRVWGRGGNRRPKNGGTREEKRGDSFSGEVNHRWNTANLATWTFQ